MLSNNLRLITSTIRNYYMKLFSKSIEVQFDLGSLNFCIVNAVIPFTKEQIGQAFRSYNKRKTPGPNGFNFFFIGGFRER